MLTNAIAAFVIIMGAIWSTGWWVNRLARTRALAGGGQDALAAARQIELLSTENSSLTGKVGRLEERIAVLERIATDPATRTAREIEDLR